MKPITTLCCLMSLAFVACDLSDSDVIQGRLPDGRGYELSVNSELKDQQADAVSAAIVIDLGVVALTPDDFGCLIPCDPVLGIITFEQTTGERPAYEKGVFRASSGDWTMTISVYGHVLRVWGPDVGDILLQHITPVTTNGELPAFTLSGPLKWANDNDIPHAMEVSYPTFVVRRGCSEISVGCSPSGSVQVIPHDFVSAPAPEWDSDWEISVSDGS